MLTNRFVDAFTYAERLHRQQRRKATAIPYISHLMAVAAAVIEWGGDEDTAIAALLHDAVEDQGGKATADEIRCRFGDHVAELVMSCTDSLTSAREAKLPWQDRKRAYVDHLATAAPQAALIATCDKVHNLSALIRDLRRDGPQTLTRFNATPQQSVWYFTAVAGAVDGLAPPALVAELRERTALFARLAGVGAGVV